MDIFQYFLSSTSSRQLNRIKQINLLWCQNFGHAVIFLLNRVFQRAEVFFFADLFNGWKEVCLNLCLR